jgi:Ca2+-binding RTX toxin-like protein
VIDNANDKITETSTGGIDWVLSYVSHELGLNLEHLELEGSANIDGTGNSKDNQIFGNSGNNVLLGENGNDTLIGGDGNDRLDGGAGNDSLVGGAGNDTYVIDSMGDSLIEAANEGIDTIQTIFSTVLGSNFENLILTGSANRFGTGNGSANALTGNSGANMLQGLAGNDTISGGAGDDTIDGGTGTDSMLGGAGNDVYIVDATSDKIVEASGGGVDQVYASANFTLAAGVENLTLTGSANINAAGNTAANILIGNDGNNALTGGSGNDTIEGGEGNDTLNGGVGADSMTGGAGDDLYIVDNAQDKVIELGNGGIDRIQASTNAALGANIENLTLTGTGNFRGSGNALDNVLIGNTGKNTLSGLAGDDWLDGGRGADVLTGGAGADHFVFSTATAGNDTITDFTRTDGDKLEFTGLQVGSFVYRGGQAFTGGSDHSEARFDSATGKLQIDTNGDGTAEFVLTLTGVTNAAQLSGSDFIWS